ncbi:Influenza virus NS1A-binding-like protein B [Armadillidium nasatum]|uniref:Influenza virus NS1A-binding-like protein B n=1 Tax=Armadillidium nasatum TaxID=96803 RepID=A0A5N5SM33_9CRUS|nr:Influenza virus NS1A-binding-like protein B [Armadillidium nasatum]
MVVLIETQLKRLVSYAYTGELEVSAASAKAMYIAAYKLKMEGIAKSCGEHLVNSLTPDSCLAVRALPGIATNTRLVSIVDQYIQQQTDLLQVTRDTLGVPKILLNVIHGSKDEANMTSRALCNLSLEWVRKQMEEEELSMQMLQEKTYLLYLNLDNSLHDCADIQTGSANDTELVQDYKKISRKLSQPNLKVRRKVSGVSQPAKPRMMLFSRSISDDDNPQDGDWKLISFSKVSENSLVAVVTLNNSVAVLSIQQQVNAPEETNGDSGNSRPPSVEKVDSYTLIPHMRSP